MEARWRLSFLSLDALRRRKYFWAWDATWWHEACDTRGVRQRAEPWHDAGVGGGQVARRPTQTDVYTLRGALHRCPSTRPHAEAVRVRVVTQDSASRPGLLVTPFT